MSFVRVKLEQSDIIYPECVLGKTHTVLLGVSTSGPVCTHARIRDVCIGIELKRISEWLI